MLNSKKQFKVLFGGPKWLSKLSIVFHLKKQKRLEPMEMKDVSWKCLKITWGDQKIFQL